MGDDEQVPKLANHWVDSDDRGITTETAPRHMKFVRVSRDELDDLKSSNNTLDLVFFSISVGAFITIATTLRTIDIVDAADLATFRNGAALSALTSCYFGISAIRGELRWRRKIENLKNSSDG